MNQIKNLLKNKEIKERGLYVSTITAITQLTQHPIDSFKILQQICKFDENNTFNNLAQAIMSKTQTGFFLTKQKKTEIFDIGMKERKSKKPIKYYYYHPFFNNQFEENFQCLMYYHQITEEDFAKKSNGITNHNIAKGSKKKGFYNQYSFVLLDINIVQQKTVEINKKISFMVFKNGKAKITGANSIEELQVCKTLMSSQLQHLVDPQGFVFAQYEEFKLAVLNFACKEPLVILKQNEKLDLKSTEKSITQNQGTIFYGTKKAQGITFEYEKNITQKISSQGKLLMFIKKSETQTAENIINAFEFAKSNIKLVSQIQM